MSHPDDETLALFVDGRLGRAEADSVLAHLDGCGECLRRIQGANEEHRAASTAFGPRGAAWRPLAIAATIAAAAFLGIMTIVRGPREPQSPTERLVALAPREARTVEPRLAGGFAWAPYRGPMRAGEETEHYRLFGAAGELVEESKRDDAPAAQHAAGTALMLIERPGEAVQRLRAAARKQPADAALRNDLGAAEYAAALKLNQPSRFVDALAAFDDALAADPRNVEALFNRALTLERLGLHIDARQAWQQYLRVDAASPWAVEARERLQRLPATTGESRFRNDQPRLELAAASGDRAALDALVRRYAQAARTFAETEYLGRWAATQSAESLAIARAIGGSLERLTGETLLRDAVAAIDRAGAERGMLAEAHLAYRRGRIAYSRQAPVAAEPELRRAAELFARGGSPMALVARYYRANTAFDQNEVTRARRELELLLGEADARPGYKALGAQVRWELALCLMNDDDWSGALPLLVASRRGFASLGETSNRGFLDGLQGDALTSLGRPDEAWAARTRSFDALSHDGWGDRLVTSIGAAARAELRSGRLEAARALAALEMNALRATGNDFTLANALVRGALLDVRLGDAVEASAKVDEASVASSRLLDAAMRARSLADVQFARGAVLLHHDARAAAAALDRALDGYVDAEAPVFLTETRLLRARAALQLGDRDTALRELEHGIAAYERYPQTSVLDAGREVYEEAIRLTLDRGDVAAAFVWCERARGARADSLAAVQQRLAGSGAMIVEPAVVAGERIAFVIREDAATVIRRVASADRLFRELPLHGVTQVIIVADPASDGAAFAASQLIDRVAVTFAPSASVLRRELTPPLRSIAAVAVASRDLPSSREELAGLARLYPHSLEALGTFASVATARADVIHVSGHAEGGNDATLVFRGERISPRRIAAATLEGQPLVLLAACATLRAARSPMRRTLSLGEGFLAAGARGVIGTVAPIADNDAREIFGRIHRHLAAGRSAADALRLAQRESMSLDRNNSAWRAVALLTRTIEAGKESS